MSNARLPLRQGEAHHARRARPCLRSASPMSASSAGSCTSPSSLPLTVYDALMAGGRETRHRQCRLPRHRVAAPGEGLPRLGRRYRARPLAARRRPRLGGEAEIEHAISGTRRARSAGGKEAAAPPCRIHHRSLDRAPGPRDHLSRRQARGLAHERRLRLHGRPLDRLRLCPRSGERRRRATPCFPAATSSRSPRHACPPKSSSIRSTTRQCRASRAEARREENGAQGRSVSI